MPASDLEKSLRRIACPVCSSAKISFTAGAEDGHAFCQNCEFRFRVIADPGRLHGEIGTLASQLEQACCPDCGGVGAQLCCRCDLPSGDRFYVVRCRGCGFIFKEEAGRNSADKI